MNEIRRESREQLIFLKWISMIFFLTLEDKLELGDYSVSVLCV